MSDDFKISLDEAVRKQLLDIAKYKEEYIKAFLAETGLMPSEVVMIQKQEGLTMRMWLEKK